MNWFTPNRFLPRTRFERKQILDWLEEDQHRHNPNSFEQFKLTQPMHENVCIMNGHCESLKKPINYGDEMMMQSQNVGFYTSELMKGKWDGYYKYRNHLMWQDGSVHKQIPMLHPDSYERIYKKFEEITLLPTVYETGGHLEYKQDDKYIHVDPTVLNNKGGVKTLVIDGPAPGRAHEVEFHIHPNSCRKGSKTCGLGWPSTADLDNILKRHWMGNKAHTVFAYEGTYTAFVKPEWRQDRNKAMQALDGVQSNIKGIVQDFMSGKRSYEDSIPLWTQTVNNDTSPLHVLFAPLGNGPLIPIY